MLCFLLFGPAAVSTQALSLPIRSIVVVPSEEAQAKALVALAPNKRADRAKEWNYALLQTGDFMTALSPEAGTTYAGRSLRLLDQVARAHGYGRVLFGSMSTTEATRTLSWINETPALSGRLQRAYEPGAGIRLRPTMVASLPFTSDTIVLGPGHVKFRSQRDAVTTNKRLNSKDVDVQPTTVRYYFVRGLTAGEQAESMRRVADELEKRGKSDRHALAEALKKHMKAAVDANRDYFGSWDGKSPVAFEELGPLAKAELEFQASIRYQVWGFGSAEAAVRALRAAKMSPESARLGFTLEVPRGMGLERFTVSMDSIGAAGGGK